MTEHGYPETTQEAIIYFSEAQVCHDFMVQMRWPDGVACPRCGCSDVRYSQTKGARPRRLWNCHGCKKQFTVKVGTIFEDSPLGLEKWLPAVWLIVNAKNGISSCEIARSLGVTQKTAWFMSHRIRVALQEGTFEKKMSGEVEADETFIGGKAQNMHKHKRREAIQGRGVVGKEIVMGLLDRGDRITKEEKKKKRGKHSTVRVKHIKDTTGATLQGEVKANVETGSILYTDAALGYQGLSEEYIHGFIDHAVAYVDESIHTNGIENFWCLLKRGLRGTYVSVNAEHLFRYLDEQAYRFNYRGGNDSDRFIWAMRSVTGKRLSYKEVTGQVR
jgi:transposase-like protein